MTGNCLSRQPRRKIAELQLPVHCMRPVGELKGVLLEQGPGLRFVAAEVAERSGMLQGELQRLNRVVKAYQPDRARQLPRGAQDGKRVGRRPQADIPDHKLAGMILKALAKLKLIDVERFGLRHRADDRMKGFVIGQRTHGTNAIVQADELVAASRPLVHNCAIAWSSAAKS